jgi:hypothetical protein
MWGTPLKEVMDEMKNKYAFYVRPQNSLQDDQYLD